MHALGIPTTRCASLILSDTLAIRDIHYNGNPKPEKCSIISRISPSFLRFGSFEIAEKINPSTGHEGPSPGDYTIIQDLADYSLEYHFPHLLSKFGEAGDGGTKRNGVIYEAWLSEIVEKTAHLVALWQSIGWTHGVLNTDNMSILGLTIDYGPFGYMEFWDRKYTPNLSDKRKRYAFDQQIAICKWNLISRIWRLLSQSGFN